MKVRNFSKKLVPTKINREGVLNTTTTSKRRHLPQLTGTDFFDVLDHAPVPLAMVSDDPEFQVLFINTEFTRVFGYHVDELKSVYDWARLVYPDTVLREQRWSMWLSEVDRLKNSPTLTSTRRSNLRCKDGSYREAILQITVLQRVLVVTYTDITEHVRLEKELLQKERQFRSFVENANDIIYIIDLEGRFTYISPNWSNVLFHDPDELLGQNFGMVVDPLDLELYWSALSQVLKGNRLLGIDYHVKQKDGSVGWQSSNLAPIYDNEGTVSAVISISRDFSEYKRIESELKQAKAKAEALNAELTKANQRLSLMASTDALTGLWNRRRFNETAVREIGRANRHTEPLSIVIFDNDHFKKLNDINGHQFGDHVLVELGKIAKQQLRMSDYLFRWGGEEFMILLPSTPAEDAVVVAEKIRQALATRPIAEGVTVTVSFGVATYRLHESLDDWIARADGALYQAKQGGRNTVRQAPI